MPRFAVPVYMMISGALMLGKEIPLEKAVKKATKAAVLLIVWNFIYLILSHILRGNKADILQEILAVPVKRQFSGHLWYIYFLVWMYLFAPILGYIYRVLSVKQQWYFIFITVLLPGILDLYNSFIFFDKNQELIKSFRTSFHPSYAGIIMLGRLLYDNAAKIKHKKIYALLSLLLGFSGAFFLTAVFCKMRWATSDLFISENRFFIVFFASGIFSLTVSLREKFNKMPMKLKKLFAFLSKRSVGIYLFHEIAIWTIPKIPYLNNFISYPYDMLLRCCVYFIITLYCVTVMSEIKIFKKIVM